MTVNRNHIKSKGILSLVSSNVNVSATVTWHSFITVNRRTVWHRRNISSSSEATGSPVQRILLPFECKSFSLLFRSCMQVTSANYVNMNNKLNCTHAGIFFPPFSSLLQPTAPPPHLRVFYHWLLQFILSEFIPKFSRKRGACRLCYTATLKLWKRSLCFFLYVHVLYEKTISSYGRIAVF